MKRIVLKLGTQVLMETDPKTGSPRLNTQRLKNICQQVIPLFNNGTQIILVSSGAVGLGQTLLNLPSPLRTLEKQTCAAVGQTQLMQNYFKIFQKHSIPIGQVLVTAEDFSRRIHFLNLSQTIERLLQLGVIPVINENDTVSTTELKENTYAPSFGDNDKLSAIVASKLNAQLLVLLTTTNGIYDKNPDLHSNALKIDVIQDIQDLLKIETKGKSKFGRGGMQAKLEAAKIASFCGVPTVIASGFKKNSLTSLFQDPFNQTPKREGTLILPKTRLTEKKQWIAFSSGFKGVLTINEGAMHALIYKKASLLPSGVVSVKGNFHERSIVSVQDLHGNEVGRGLVFYSSENLKKILDSETKTRSLKTKKESKEIIHRNHLALFVNPD